MKKKNDITVLFAVALAMCLVFAGCSANGAGAGGGDGGGDDLGGAEDDGGGSSVTIKVINNNSKAINAVAFYVPGSAIGVAEDVYIISGETFSFPITEEALNFGNEATWDAFIDGHGEVIIESSYYRKMAVADSVKIANGKTTTITVPEGDYSYSETLIATASEPE